MVDFESITCSPGSLLVVRPGQVQRFNMNNNWQGWVLILRPEFLQPFIAYRRAVERNFQHWHQVADYAKHLACSEKSLSRATHRIAKFLVFSLRPLRL